MTSIYLAGPMRGYPQFNRPAFEKATSALRSQGHKVISPLEMDDLFNPEIASLTPDHEFTKAEKRTIILRDCEAVSNCENISLLPAWEASRGARVEFALAEFLGLGFRYGYTGEGANLADLKESLGRQLIKEAKQLRKNTA